MPPAGAQPREENILNTIQLLPAEDTQYPLVDQIKQICEVAYQSVIENGLLNGDKLGLFRIHDCDESGPTIGFGCIDPDDELVSALGRLDVIAHFSLKNINSPEDMFSAFLVSFAEKHIEILSLFFLTRGTN